jgi:oxygen-dependent protoporphyrinogen oxidase
MIPGVNGADRHVVVIGGGISGLAAAHALRRALPAVRITLVEESARLGGKLCTGELGGAVVETGADNWLARVPEATALANAVGADLVTPATGDAWLWIGDRLRRLPSGTVRGVPSRIRPLARVLSPAGLARAAVEPWLPGKPLDGPSTVGALVTRRLGRQVTERLVEPLLGGVYAGRADDLDLDASAPDLAALAHAGRSLVRAARERPAPGDGPVFHSARGGLTTLVDAVHAASNAEVVTARAATVERLSGAFRVTLAGGRALVADGVVVATPAKPAARLLDLVAPDAAAALKEIAYASVALVGLAYRGDVALPKGSGILVPPGARLTKAVTFYGQKWPHTAVPKTTLLRASVGRAGEPVTLDPPDLVNAVHAELAPLLRLRHKPFDAFVAEWPDGLPQYALGHLDRVERIEGALPPGLATAGAAYRGVGIAACVRSGNEAAARVAAHVAARG